jgi:D-alanine-D-alanine ligase
MARRLRVLLLFGGRSAEHDVSRVTAVAVAGALDPTRYEVVPVAITTEGRWLVAADAAAALADGASSLPPAFAAAGEPLEGLGELVAQRRATGPLDVDVVFPLLH